MDFSAKNFVGS